MILEGKVKKEPYLGKCNTESAQSDFPYRGFSLQCEQPYILPFITFPVSYEEIIPSFVHDIQYHPFRIQRRVRSVLKFCPVYREGLKRLSPYPAHGETRERPFRLQDNRRSFLDPFHPSHGSRRGNLAIQEYREILKFVRHIRAEPESLRKPQQGDLYECRQDSVQE